MCVFGFWFFFVYVRAIPLLSLSCTSICGLLWALPTPNTSCHMLLAVQLATHVSPSNHCCIYRLFLLMPPCKGHFTSLEEWESEVRPSVQNLDTLVVFICIIIHTHKVAFSIYIKCQFKLYSNANFRVYRTKISNIFVWLIRCGSSEGNLTTDRRTDRQTERLL